MQGGFPKRKVERVVIDGLSDDAPELVLSRLLDDYRGAREERFASTTRRAQAAAGLLVVGLQQRLLSSTEAFARSLRVHRATVERQWKKSAEKSEIAAKTGEQPHELLVQDIMTLRGRIEVLPNEMRDALPRAALQVRDRGVGAVQVHARICLCDQGIVQS